MMAVGIDQPVIAERCELHLNGHSFSQHPPIVPNFLFYVLLDCAFDVLLYKQEQSSEFAHEVGAPIGLVDLEPALGLFLEVFSEHFGDGGDDLVGQVVGEVAHHQHVIGNESFEGVEALVEVEDAVVTDLAQFFLYFVHQKDQIIPEENASALDLLDFALHRLQDQLEHLTVLNQLNHSGFGLVPGGLFDAGSAAGQQMEGGVGQHTMAEKYLVHRSFVVVIELQKILQVEESYADQSSDVVEHLLGHLWRLLQVDIVDVKIVTGLA